MMHYRDVFEPLILLETWSQLLKSKEEKPPVFVAGIVGRRNRDEWLELEMTITEAVPKTWYLAETDVVLLRQAGGTNHILGKISSSRRNAQGLQISVLCAVFSEALMPMDQQLLINTKWELSKVLRYVCVFLL